MAGFMLGTAGRIWFRTSNTSWQGGRRSTRGASKVDLEDKKENNEQRTLGTTTWHSTVTRDSAMIPDTEAPVGKIGNYELEGTGGDVEVTEDCHNDVVGHSVEGFAEIDSRGNDSTRVLGGVVESSEDEIHHSNDIVDNGAARESAKLITTNMGGNKFPDPFNQQFFQPFT